MACITGDTNRVVEYVTPRLQLDRRSVPRFASTCPPRPTVTCVEDPIDPTELVAHADEAGDNEAWRALVKQYSRAVHRALSAFRLSSHERDELLHETFVKLVENLDRIEEPKALASWLMTTARRLALAHLRRTGRVVPTADFDDASNGQPIDESLLDSELHGVVAAAFNRLGEACQRLLRLLTAQPPLAYADIALALDWPIGSIGPRRQRCLANLMATPEIKRYLGGDS